jgi:lysophospholipase L1-like esterase
MKESWRQMTARTRRTVIARQAGRLVSTTLLQALMNPMQEARRTQFAALASPRGRVVMLGDSITEFGMWSEWFPNAPMANRGIGGERSGDVRARLHTAIDQPRAVFLLVGTNDLAVAIPEHEIAANVAAIVDTISRVSPGTPIYLQSVMPRDLAYRDEVLSLNERYREIAEAAETAHYLDLWPALATPEGALNPEMTNDSLHLNGNGYRAWVDVLKPIITGIQKAPHAKAAASAQDGAGR